MMAFAFYIAG